ncbi:hypothetical protein BC830DRAFT_1127441 [Chytriomyces sp. MP71]|nr:hypothetical protein BC830DRAFT_1127441 [Chytriomyces sp. MP71]
MSDPNSANHKLFVDSLPPLSSTASSSLLPPPQPPARPPGSVRKKSFSLAPWTAAATSALPVRPSPPVSPNLIAAAPSLALSMSKSNMLPMLPPLKVSDSSSELNLSRDSGYSSSSFLHEPILPANSGLPSELWIRILCFIPNLENFSLVSKAANALLKDLQVRQLWLFGRYGVKLAINGGLTHYRFLCGDLLLHMLLKGGANIPRFLVQVGFDHFKRGIVSGPATHLDFLVVQYCRKRGFYASRVTVKEPGTDGVEGYVFPNGLVTDMPIARAEAVWNRSDANLFDQLMNGTSPENLDGIRRLIVEENFIPVLESNPTSLFRIFQLSQMDMALFDHMIRFNGFRVTKVNDEVLRRVIATTRVADLNALPVPGVQRSPTLKSYLSRGFKLSSKLIKSIILDAANTTDLPKVLFIVSTHVPSRQLRRIALDIVKEMVGPTGISFVPNVLNHFLDMPVGLLNTDDIQRALVPESGGVLCERVPYTTRCYEQAQPYRVWQWVLERFGVAHPLTAYCFDDLLQWLGDLSARKDWHMPRKPARKDFSERPANPEELNPFSLYVAPFVETGVLVLPRHVQFLAKAARCKHTAPMPATILSLAFRSLIRRGEQATAIAEMEEERGRNHHLGPNEHAHHHHHHHYARSQSRTNSKERRGLSRDKNLRVAFEGRAQGEPGKLKLPGFENSLSFRYSDLAISRGPSTEQATRMPLNEEMIMWIEAIRLMFADATTVRAIKQADAEWFKEWKIESEAQERKDLALVGLPLKKTWSGSGLGKRTDFGAGWWDMFVGMGGGGLSKQGRNLGIRNSARPGRFLDIANEMIQKLIADLKK